jgi:rhamnulokinase
MQAVTLGHLGSLVEARDVVRTSFDIETYKPAGDTDWDKSYQKLVELIN